MKVGDRIELQQTLRPIGPPFVDVPAGTRGTLLDRSPPNWDAGAYKVKFDGYERIRTLTMRPYQVSSWLCVVGLLDLIVDAVGE